MNQGDKVAALKCQLPNLSAKDLSFATDLVTKGEKYSLSSAQMYWVERLTDQAMGFGMQKTQKTEEVGGFSKVIEMFALAKQHLQYPKISLKVGEQRVQLSLAGPAAKEPGTVNVTDGRPYGQNIWFGRVNAQGLWTQNSKLQEDQLKPIRRLLKDLAEDPAETAKKYATLTGRCCFCHLKLTDKRSTAVGYGETCSKHFGLHKNWQEAVAVFEKAQAA